MKRIDKKTEARILAMVARGDKYKDILARLEEDGIKMSISNITHIKNKNPGALEEITTTILEHEKDIAVNIHKKSSELIQKKLKKGEKYLDEYPSLYADMLDGKITADEYNKRMAHMQDIALTELVTVSKEAYKQSGAGDPEAPNPIENRKKLDELMAAIKNGDEVALERIVLNPGK